jgi:hypothetical protein
MSEPAPLHYAARDRFIAWRYIGAALPFVALGASMAVAFAAYLKMDANRLLWEGADQYFLTEFPFRTVLSLSAIGAIVAVARLVIVPRKRRIALLAIACNAAWAWHWVGQAFA